MMLAAVDVQIDYARLQTLLAFKGESIPYRRLTLLTQVHPDLQITLQQGSIAHLTRAIDAGTPPAIFVLTADLPYWRMGVYHSIVLVGYTDSDFYINDPAFAEAPQVASIGDVDLAWLENDTYYAVIERKTRKP